MLKVSPAAHALFQVLSALELHVPARGERSRAQNVRGAYRKRLHSFSPHSHTRGGFCGIPRSLSPRSLASSSKSAERDPRWKHVGGGNKNGERMGCSCSRALHLVSLIILRSVLNKTTIKIL